MKLLNLLAKETLVQSFSDQGTLNISNIF